MSESIKEACDLVRSGEGVLVDVRELDEWEAGHLKDAHWFPFSDLEEGLIPEDLPEDKALILYCAKGGRARKAFALMKERYPKLHPNCYGFEELRNAGLPAE